MTTPKNAHPDSNAVLDPLVLEAMLLAIDPVESSPDRADRLCDRVMAIARPTAMPPGTPTSDLVDYIRGWFAERSAQEA